MTQEHYLLAVDGGGTKTEFCARCVETGRQFSKRYGSANYKSSSEETAYRSIVEGFEDFIRCSGINRDHITSAVFGFAGCDTREDMDFYCRTVSRIGLDPRCIHVYNDSEMVLQAVVDQGICVVAGTGAIAMGITDCGRKERVGGWGIPLSDEGSGWWIGARVLQHYLRWCDGLEGENPFFCHITRWLGTEGPASPAERVIRLSNREIASLARDVLGAAGQDNVLCGRIVDESAHWIGALVTAAYEKMGFSPSQEIPVVTLGSLFCDERYAALVRREIRRSGLTNLRYIMPEGTPASYGLRLAEKLWRRPGFRNPAEHRP